MCRTKHYFFFLYKQINLIKISEAAAALLQRRYKRQTPYIGEKEEQKSKYSEQLEKKKKKDYCLKTKLRPYQTLPHYYPTDSSYCQSKYFLAKLEAI